MVLLYGHPHRLGRRLRAASGKPSTESAYGLARPELDSTGLVDLLGRLSYTYVALTQPGLTYRRAVSSSTYVPTQRTVHSAG